MSDRDGYRQRVTTVRGRARAQLQAMRKERLARKRKALAGPEQWPTAPQPPETEAHATGRPVFTHAGFASDAAASAGADEATVPSAGDAPPAGAGGPPDGPLPEAETAAGTGAEDRPDALAGDDDFTEADPPGAFMPEEADAGDAAGSAMAARPAGPAAGDADPEPGSGLPEVEASASDPEPCADAGAEPGAEDAAAVLPGPRVAHVDVAPEPDAPYPPAPDADLGADPGAGDPNADRGAAPVAEQHQPAPPPDHGAPGAEGAMAAAASAPRDTDLLEIPGIGSGLVWMLRAEGVTSLADLAAADAADLGRRLGVVSRLLDLDDLVAFARARRTDPGARRDATSP